LLQLAGAPRSLAPVSGAVYTLPPSFVQLALRELTDRGQLESVALATRAALGGRSVADTTQALALGDWPGFVRAHARQRLPHPAGERSRSAWLRESLCEAFDAAWLTRTWRDKSLEVALRVLRESLHEPSECTALLAWLRAGGAQPSSEQETTALAATFCAQALLRGEVEHLRECSTRLPPRESAAYRAAALFLEGDLPAAQQQLDAAFAGGAPRVEAAGPLLALLLTARGTKEAKTALKRLLSPRRGVERNETARSAERALRRLLRYLETPVEQHRRLDVFQLHADAGAWEILLTALTVSLHLQQPSTRAGWSAHVVTKALTWRAAGYHWIAKQALLLAAELDDACARRTLAKAGQDASLLVTAPRELRSWDLVQPKPEWEKTLEALAQISDSLGASRRNASRRVAWYVDMSDGSFSRPALQEYREEAGAWSAGQRVSIEELYALRGELPPEDARVLECSRETLGGRRELTEEAYELLIGHPRVHNGARPGAPIEVARGSCRIETSEEAGYIQLVVEPAGAKLGVNVVSVREDRLLVYRVTEDMRRVMAALPHGVRVPVSRELELLEVLERLSPMIEVRSPRLAAERSEPANATPCLRLAPQAGAWLVQAGVRPFGSQGRFFLAGAGRGALTLLSGATRVRLERNLELERSLLAALVAECPSLRLEPEHEEAGEPSESTDSWVFSTEGVLVLLSELRDTNVRHTVEWRQSSLELAGKGRSKNLHVRLRAVKGWYIASGELHVDETTHIPLGDLVRAPLLAHGRFLRLPSGAYLELEARIQRVVQALSAVAALRGRGSDVPVHPAALGPLRALTDTDNGIEADEAARQWLGRVDRCAELSFELPPGFKAELRPYQHDGYRWLCRLTELGLGACLADDMGLGKTIQILALLLRREREGPALVVAPTSVCANWLREIERFAPSLRGLDYAGSARSQLLEQVSSDGAGTVLVCSYALLQQDQHALSQVSWAAAVLDEAQFIKNPESLRARAAFRLQARHRVVATGTPVENHAADLWSLFHFLNPGLLGDWPHFRRRFASPIERDASEQAALELHQLVRPYVLRRMKKDVLTELPPLTTVEHAVYLGPDERTLYTLLRKQIYEKLRTTHGKRQHKLQVLAEITRLRRFCCHPRLVFPEATHASSKIDTLIELVEELRENGHRALVFSQYTDFLELVREALDEHAVSHEYLDGSTPTRERQARIDAFQNGSATLFLISLKAGGFGLNLTAADYVVHLDPWWNPAVSAQATDRAHRIGQARKVTVYNLVTRDTIEEDIVKLHAKKRRLAASVLEGTAQVGELSTEELLRLLGAGVL
jgi:superfamily II DNA or RNA helicase